MDDKRERRLSRGWEYQEIEPGVKYYVVWCDECPGYRCEFCSCDWYKREQRGYKTRFRRAHIIECPACGHEGLRYRGGPRVECPDCAQTFNQTYLNSFVLWLTGFAAPTTWVWQGRHRETVRLPDCWAIRRPAVRPHLDEWKDLTAQFRDYWKVEWPYSRWPWWAWQPYSVEDEADTEDETLL